jgi:hypothetical protein
MFPDFSERTVEINHSSKRFTVPKLSILQYSQAVKIMWEAEITGNISTAGKKLWLLLETVLPEDILRDREIFAYNELAELCIYLAFGTYLDDKSMEADEEYCDVPNLPDYQFEAARILSQFNAYTLEKLLDEPASVFFAMSDHADRVIADNAIEIIANGVKAAFSNFKQLSTKRGGLTVPNPDSSRNDIPFKSKNKSA